MIILLFGPRLYSIIVLIHVRTDVYFIFFNVRREKYKERRLRESIKEDARAKLSLIWLLSILMFQNVKTQHVCDCVPT